MSIRAGQLGPLSLRQAGYRNLRWIVIMAAAVVIAMVVVGGKSQVVRLGYRINDLEKQKRELERANRALTIEASSLSAPARVEEIAVSRFGMVRPAKENIVVVKRRQASAAGSGPSAGER